MLLKRSLFVRLKKNEVTIRGRSVAPPMIMAHDVGKRLV